jgi:hypothetical protein
MLASQVCTPLPEHCVAPGAYAPHVPVAASHTTCPLNVWGSEK